MTAAPAPATPHPAPAPAGNPRSRVVIASLIGTSIEFYDFYVYATAAVLVFPTLFFPNEDPTASQLSSFVTFALAFFARPVGSIIFGHFGDRIGRKTTLVASLLVMGTATFLIGCLPTFDTHRRLGPGPARRDALRPGRRPRRRVVRRGPARDRERPEGQARRLRLDAAARRADRLPARERPVHRDQRRDARRRRRHAERRLPGVGLAHPVPALRRARASSASTCASSSSSRRCSAACRSPARSRRSRSAGCSAPRGRRVIVGTFGMVATYVLFYFMTTFTLSYGTTGHRARPARPEGRPRLHPRRVPDAAHDRRRVLRHLHPDRRACSPTGSAAASTLIPTTIGIALFGLTFQFWFAASSGPITVVTFLDRRPVADGADLRPDGCAAAGAVPDERPVHRLGASRTTSRRSSVPRSPRPSRWRSGSRTATSSSSACT